MTFIIKYLWWVKTFVWFYYNNVAYLVYISIMACSCLLVQTFFYFNVFLNVIHRNIASKHFAEPCIQFVLHFVTKY